MRAYGGPGPRVDSKEALVRRLIVRLGFDPNPISHEEAAAAVAGLRADDSSSMIAAATRLISRNPNVQRVGAADGDVVLCVGCHEPIAEGEPWLLRGGRIPAHVECGDRVGAPARRRWGRRR